MKTREVIPLIQSPNWTLSLPGSKSITNRVFLCAALTKGKSRIYGALKSDDADVMLKALKKVGVKVKEAKKYIEITGKAGEFDNGKRTLDLHNAGTATRFLTAVMTLRDGITVITGNKRMQERPIRDLVEGLRQMDIKVDYLKKNGCPPIAIKRINSSNKEYVIKMKGDKSSQYFSALLMLAPCLSKPLKIEVIGDLVSKPYIDITLSVLKQFGIKVKNNNYKSFVIKPQEYRAGEYLVEGDASSASYWTSIAHLHGGKVKFANLNKKSVQGDVKYSEMLPKLGKGELDMEPMPDAAMTLAVTAPFIKGVTKIEGLSTLRIKETDRLAALEKELKKFKVKVKTTKGSIVAEGPFKPPKDAIDTYDDHRVAMCFAVVGTKVPGVVIKDPDCTEKTYPTFWEDLELSYLNKIKLGQKNLVLTGMRCSGKSYFGKRIARLLKRGFVDLDLEIEKREKMKIPEIVKCYGWPYFRKLEQKICSEYSKAKNLVIATGGGVVLSSKNMKSLKKNGINVFIFADVSTLVYRIKNSSGNRPSLTGKKINDELVGIWKERRDLYLKYADYVWDDTSGEVIKKNLEQIFCS